MSCNFFFVFRLMSNKLCLNASWYLFVDMSNNYIHEIHFVFASCRSAVNVYTQTGLWKGHHSATEKENISCSLLVIRCTTKFIIILCLCACVCNFPRYLQCSYAIISYLCLRLEFTHRALVRVQFLQTNNIGGGKNFILDYGLPCI